MANFGYTFSFNLHYSVASDFRSLRPGNNDESTNYYCSCDVGCLQFLWDRLSVARPPYLAMQEEARRQYPRGKQRIGKPHSSE